MGVPSAVLSRTEAVIQRLLAEPERARRVYPALLLALTLAVWFPSLFTGLDAASPDDFYHVTQTALHHSPRDIAGWFLRGYWAYSHYEYRPLTRLSLLVTYLIFGPRPWGFHLCNVLLHFVCSLLLACVAFRAGAPSWAARLAGLVAAVFPPGQMAVTWINGRQDVLCAACLLGGVHCFLSWLAGRAWPHLTLALALIALSALAKEPGAAALLLLLAAIFLVPTRRTVRQRLAAVALVCLVLAPYVWLRLKAWPLAEYAAQNAPQLRPVKVSFIWLLGDLLAPRSYELATTWRTQGWLIAFSPRFPRLLIEQIALWAGAIALWQRNRRCLALPLVWKVVFFLPVHNLYWNPAFTHYRYLPHLGTAWLVGLATWELAGYAAGKMHRWGRPLVRWAIVGLGLLMLAGYYGRQLDLRWPTWSLIAQGGPKPPAAFGRSLTGPGTRQLERSQIHPPGDEVGDH